MLSPEYLESLPEPVLELVRAMEDTILVKMAARIAKYGWTEQSQWEKDRLEAVGMIQADIVRIVAQYSGKTQKAIEKLMAEAGVETVVGNKPFYAAAGKWSEEAINRDAMNKIINAGLKRTQQTFRNLTGTLAKETAKEFTYAMDKAFLAASTGTIDPQTAGRRAIHELCQQGIRVVSYPSGHVDNVEVAVRRALVTGVNQNTMQIQEELAEELNCDLVEVTAHAGARTGDGIANHAAWQGKVYSLRGKTPGYQTLTEGTGYQNGTGLGLGGYNCRHNFHPFFPGMTPAYSEDLLRSYEEKKYTYNGKKLTEYEAMEQQRYFERGIRRWKREYVAMEAGGYDTTEAAVRLKSWREKEADFLRQTGRQRDSSRSQIGTFGRSEAAKATWAAKNIQGGRNSTIRSLTEAKNGSIIKNITMDDLNAANATGAVTQQCLEEIDRAIRTCAARYDAVTIQSIARAEIGTPVFRTVVQEHGGWCRTTLEINTKVFGEKTVNEVNDILAKSQVTNHSVVGNIGEAIRHESIHAKLANDRNFAQYKALCDTLEDVHIDGISKTAFQNGEECLCEIAVLLDRGDDVPESALRLWNNYFGG